IEEIDGHGRRTEPPREIGFPGTPRDGGEGVARPDERLQQPSPDHSGRACDENLHVSTLRPLQRERNFADICAPDGGETRPANRGIRLLPAQRPSRLSSPVPFTVDDSLEQADGIGLRDRGARTLPIRRHRGARATNHPLLEAYSSCGCRAPTPWGQTADSSARAIAWSTGRLQQ